MPWTHRGRRLGSGCMSQVTTWGTGWAWGRAEEEYGLLVAASSRCSGSGWGGCSGSLASQAVSVCGWVVEAPEAKIGGQLGETERERKPGI